MQKNRAKVMKKKKLKTKLKLGDFVEIIAGKEKGKRGKIKELLLRAGRVIVDGVNISKRHKKPSQKSPQGGILALEAPIDLSNLMIVDPETNKPTRIATKKRKSKTVRVTKASDTVLETSGGRENAAPSAADS
jgi:large subunit ribosomal protein L24